MGKLEHLNAIRLSISNFGTRLRFPVFFFTVFFKCILLRKCFAQAKHIRRAKLDAYCQLRYFRFEHGIRYSL